MCAEIMFRKLNMEFLVIKVAIPIIVRVDNVGASYGVIKLIYLKSEDKNSNIFKKIWVRSY
jgi:hypothetical protein